MPWVVSIFCTWWRDKRVAHAGGVQGDIPLPPFPSCPGIKASGPPDRASSEGTVGGGGGSGWKRKPCFPLLPSRVNHAPTAAIRFSSLQGGWCRAERASLDVPVSEEKGGGGGSAVLGQGQRPRGEGGGGAFSSFSSAVITYFQLKSEPSPAAWEQTRT